MPAYTDYKEASGEYTVEGDVLKIRIGKSVHEWALKNAAKRFLERSVPSYLFQCAAGQELVRDCLPGFNPSPKNHTIEGTEFRETHGFGYLNASGPRLDQEIGMDRLAPFYSGEYYESIGYKGSPKFDDSTWCPGWTTRYAKDGDVSLGTKWCRRQVSRRKALFKEGAMPMYTNPSCGIPGTPVMYCYTTWLFNHAPWSNLIFYENGGHDYNTDGCPGTMDPHAEGNHASMFLGVWEGGRVTKWLYVEHSWQWDGYPIVGVGRLD